MFHSPSHRKWVHHTSAYRGKGAFRLRVPRAVLCILIFLAAAALILFGVALHLQQYMVYSREGGVMVLPGREEPEALASPQDNLLTGLDVLEETAPPSSPDAGLRALRVSVQTLLAGDALERLDAAGGNALILDMKPVSGVLCWATAQTLGEAESPISPDASKIGAALERLKAEGVYLIAQIHCFQDQALALDPLLALPGGEDDASYPGWLDPGREDVQEYLSQLAAELAGLGFDELLISDGAYPGDWENKALSPEQRAETLDQFYARLGAALEAETAGAASEESSGVKLGVEVDGLSSGSLSGSGQSLAALLSRFQRVWCAEDGWDGLDTSSFQTQLQAGRLVWAGSAFQEEAPPSPAQAVFTP